MKILCVFVCFLFSCMTLAKDTMGDSPSYYGDISPIIQNKCLGCHSDDGVSFSLEDPELAYNFRAAISSAIAEKRMPPWLAEGGHQEYRDDISLSEEQLSLFSRWSESGFPKGVPKRGESKKEALSDDGFVEHLSLEASKIGYLPKQNVKDDYRCFLIDWPGGKNQYMTGFKASPSNTRIIHHIVVFLVQPELVETMKQVESKNPDEGYACSTGIAPDYLADKKELDEFKKSHPGGVAEIYNNSSWLAHWAPGINQYSLPDDTGVLIKKGSAIVVQFHYYSVFAPGERDSGTRVSFSLSDSVSKPAAYIALTNNNWLMSRQNQSMVVPASEERTFELSAPLSSLVGYAALVSGTDKENIQEIELLSSNIHMHSYGASASSKLTHSSGDKEVLLSIPRWDIGWQRDFTYAKGKSFERSSWDDVFYTLECTFKNYSKNTVYGGFGSDDEMCFDFIYVAIDHEGQ